VHNGHDRRPRPSPVRTATAPSALMNKAANTHAAIRLLTDVATVTIPWHSGA
jgi:hypothetical protein